MKRRIIAFTVALGIALAVGLAYQSEASQPDVIVLSEINTINLNRPISGESVRDTQIELMDKSAKLPRRAPIYLVLNSPGGDIDAGEKLIETAKGLPQHIDTISIFSASMSFVISQYLNTRYVLSSSSLMSHRATAGGMAGQVPGNLLSRTMDLLAHITRIDTDIASRAHIPLDTYRNMTRDELWMDGEQSVSLKFADKVVRVRCDASLTGPGRSETVNVLFFTVKITFDKCPLITTPLEIQMQGGDSTNRHDAEQMIIEMLYDKPNFVRDWVETGKLARVLK